MGKLRRKLDSVLERFAAWFCSGSGVWQTAFVTLCIVVVECSDRSLDPHAFVLMAALTVYSAITQPALAYSGARSAEQMERLLDVIERRDCRIESLVAHIKELEA